MGRPIGRVPGDWIMLNLNYDSASLCFRIELQANYLI